MNAETLTTPVTKLPEHVQDLRRSANNIAQDLKTEATSRITDAKAEVQSRIEDARGQAQDTFEVVKGFATEHPFAVFGAGLVTGLLIAGWRK
jgi:ElaB/YqjD/DUF883 family membrane-anchored ribosome-binding protein